MKRHARCNRVIIAEDIAPALRAREYVVEGPMPGNKSQKMRERIFIGHMRIRQSDLTAIISA